MRYSKEEIIQLQRDLGINLADATVICTCSTAWKACQELELKKIE